jgi:hypothetical protein
VGDPAELLRVPERLEIEEHDVGALVLLHHSSRSFDETSALLPIETNAEKPRPRSDAFSSIARPSAPLWDDSAIRPGGGAPGAKVAFKPIPGTAIPRPFGPMSRAPCARTSASSCSWRSTPSAPISAKPAEMTQSARTPFRSDASADSSTCSPGTQMTARSTWSGISAIVG